eukprot:6213223-Pleurochrysis_carterae.AAC.2
MLTRLVFHVTAVGLPRQWTISDVTTRRTIIGSFDVASLARMSLAIVRHWRSHAPFCLGTCGDMVVRRMPFSSRKSLICCKVKSPALSVCMRLMVVKVDDVLLSAVDVWHTYTVNVVAHQVACGFRCWPVCRRVHRVAVCSQAIVAGDVACNVGPCLWGIARALQQQSQDFRPAVVEACVQNFCCHVCAASLFAIALCDYCWRCDVTCGWPWYDEYTYIE